MISHPHREPGRGSCIVGQSVHNQRNERHLKYISYGCKSVLHDLFCYLEEKLLLHVNNPSHV